ncbi:glycosyl transferase family 2 [Kineococcus xinjiangensis]|uniref:Glycosyl transferase family 2 n=1 Tax=Kineococcus xinjiangensis TaxID=512762 RepID=A0A2S6IJU7_9ACTN|nr:glycosyltransferase family 2 protein [Kineococcus xinjiangensis]PPK94503.1 glycosyl transferase family 2 [Kineococcus xinjiangensis]
MHGDEVFISGSYIVKDEEELLGGSLDALRPFVDELVVYDTGSTDATRDVARAHGARVVEGYWDDDFGAARNRALEHCAGEWVVIVDADEVARGNPRALRRRLRLTPADALSVMQVSHTWQGAGVGLSVWSVRVFRRARCRWEGAIHERVVGRWGELSGEQTTDLELDHSGYTPVRTRERNKGGRNLRVAERELADALARGASDTWRFLINVARSGQLEGDPSRSLEALALVDRAAVAPQQGILAGHTALGIAVANADMALGLDWLASMAQWGESPDVLRAMEGQLAMATGDLQRAEALLRPYVESGDQGGVVLTDLSFTDSLIDCLWLQDRHEESVELLLDHLATGKSHIAAAVVLARVHESRTDSRRLVDALPESLVLPYVGQLQATGFAYGEPFFEAMWDAGRARTAVLVAISGLGGSLPFEKALLWSLRMREAGLGEHCPLWRILRSTERDDRTRIMCGAALVEIGEEAALPLLEPLLARVDDDAAGALVEELRQFAPGFTAALIAG